MGKEFKQPFYNPLLSYETNYQFGPFGDFSKFIDYLPINKQNVFLGYPVDIPFGIAAGPLVNSKFVEAAWRWGFSLTTYKTVRGQEYPSHPFPNVIKVNSLDGDIKPGAVVIGDMDMTNIDIEKQGITNSFGVPSKPVGIWSNDVKTVMNQMTEGKVLILSFMGTKQEGMNLDAYIRDFAKTCQIATATGAPILEVNFSCPNVGREGLICNDVETSRAILEELKTTKSNKPLLVKIGYFPSEQQELLEGLFDAIYDNADGVVAINTIQAKVTDKRGTQILPGNPVRLFSGICGAAIRWAGLEMAERIMAYKKKKGWKDFVVVGVGGVVTPNDYFEYMKRGVDAVQSATGAMWRPHLAMEIRAKITELS